MSIEPFVYLFLFILFGVISFVVRWLKREFDKSDENEKTKLFGLFQQPPSVIANPTESIPSPEAITIQESVLPPDRTKGKRGERIIHPRNLGDMRRGMVLRTVLGPCRALEPPNESFRF